MNIKEIKEMWGKVMQGETTVTLTKPRDENNTVTAEELAKFALAIPSIINHLLSEVERLEDICSKYPIVKFMCPMCRGDIAIDLTEGDKHILNPNYTKELEKELTLLRAAEEAALAIAGDVAIQFSTAENEKYDKLSEALAVLDAYRKEKE
jgi:hypothetical protein